VANKDRKKKRSKSGGGTLSGLRGGFKGVVGAGKSRGKKESLLSKFITYLLLAAAVGVLIYRFTR
jgi:hypothetical protein